MRRIFNYFLDSKLSFLIGAIFLALPLFYTEAAEVVINPGQSILAAVNANPEGTSFLLKAGVYSRQTVYPKNGNTFIGEAGAIMDGENAVDYAFAGGPANGVTIKNLEIKNYLSNKTLGVIMGWDFQNLTLENLNVHDNVARGYNGRATGLKVLGGRYHHNTGGGLGIINPNNALIDGVELDNNNLGGAFDPLWGVAGIKSDSVGNGLTIRNVYAHDNNSPGIWVDGGASNVIIENNRSERNKRAGIFYEISHGAIIRNNTVKDIGDGTGGAYRAAILISESDNVEIYSNTIDNAPWGIALWQQARPLDGNPLVKNVYVHNNLITVFSADNIAAGGGGYDPNGVIEAMYASQNNRFEGNTYNLMKAGEKPFRWTGKSTDTSQFMGQPLNEAEWRAASQDVNGIFNRATLQGDLNNDRIVNSLDWSLMSSKWLTSDAIADLNKDGVVNTLDWSIMSGNWLKTI